VTEADRPDVAVDGEEPAKPAGSSPEPGGEALGNGSAEPAPDTASLQAQLAERTADLQRVQADYLNYKRRVERDRELVKQTATYAALVPIVEVLDTIDRAREHGEVDGGFQAVAEQLERVVAGVGLTKFGQVGDAFDPTVHEALSHIGEDPDVTVTTCKVIAKAGYRIGDRVVRAAQVLVVDPPSDAPDPAQHASAEVQPEDPEVVDTDSTDTFADDIK
jgi:molecular chaperone GrpE